MTGLSFHIPDLSSEFQFITSRSGGPGGQNVNKVNSRVELRFNVQNSLLLSDEQKEIILIKLSGKISSEGFLSVVSQRCRSQLANKEDAITKFYLFISKALQPIKPRRSTGPTRSSVEKRLAGKRIKAVIKQNRQKFDE